MAIVQISKIQQRAGNLVDLPQLDNGEFGWATDTNRLFIGKTGNVYADENIEVLTSYSNISFSQIEGSDGGNFNITTPLNGQILTYVSSTDTWENYSGNTSQFGGTKLQLGSVSNIAMTGGAIGYVLQTDGLGNLSWTPKGTLYTDIKALTNNPTGNIITMTVANTVPYTNNALVTISGVVGTNVNTIVNGQAFYVQLDVDYPTSGNLKLYTTTGNGSPANGAGLTATANTGIATSLIGGSGGGGSGTGGTNTTVQFNDSGILNGNAGFTFDKTTTTLTVSSGNIITGNINATSLITAPRLVSNIATGTSPLTVTSTTRVANLNVSYANVSDYLAVTFQTSGTYYPLLSSSTSGNVAQSANADLSFNAATGALTATLFTGTLTTAAQPNITSTGTLTSLAVTGNISAGNVSATTFTGALTGNASGSAATVTTAAQPNITSTGTLTSLAVTGNISAGNVSATTFTGALTGNATTAGTVITAAQPNITSTGTLTSLAVTGNISAGNATLGNLVTANFFTGNGYLLTGVGNATALVNGNSNVSIPSANGNVNISAVGNANIVVVTGTGVNVAGTLNTTGNTVFSGANITLGAVGNVKITGGSNTQVLQTDGSGNLAWANSVGGYYLHTQSSGNTVWNVVHNLNNQYVSVEPIDNTGNSYTGRYNYPTVNYTNANALTLTFSSAVTGWAAVVGGGYTTSSNVTPTPSGFDTYVQYNNAGNLGANSAFTFTVASGRLNATVFAGSGANLTNIPGANVTDTVANATYAASSGTAGTVTTAAQGNITSVGTLTSLNSSGTITAPAFTANTGVFTGNANGLSSLVGANVTGAVSYATTANSVAGANVTGAVSYATTANSVAGANVSGTVANATYAVSAGSATTAGTVTTAAQSNITSVGTLTSLAVTGIINSVTRPVIPSSLLNAGAGNVTIYQNTVVNGSFSTSCYSIALHPFGTFAFSGQGNNIVQYRVYDGGGLSFVDTTSVGAPPSSLIVHPTGKFLYAITYSNNSIVSYSINQNSGYPTFVNTITNGYGPVGKAISPNGLFLYFASTTGTAGFINQVSWASINQTTGALVWVGRIACGTLPSSIAIDPTGRFLYVTNKTDNTVSQFSVDQTAGTLTAITTAIATGTTPSGIVVDPTGRFVYVTNSTSNTVSQFSINQTTGALTSISSSIGAGTYPSGIAADPTGKFIYVSNNSSNTISQFSIDQNSGALTSISSAIATGTSPGSLAVIANGQYLYAVIGGQLSGSSPYNGIQSYIINAFMAGSVTSLRLTTGANTTAGNITGTWSLTTGSSLTATYADLAEYYKTDKPYEAGTVLAFGGDKEVTLAEDCTTRVAGVVSTNPAYVMNSSCEGEFTVAIALQGRVPCKVRGKIFKGDMLVSGGNGFARPVLFPVLGTVIGKALENFEGEGVIEVAISRM